MSALLAFQRDTRGSSAAEFALILPVFLLGIIDLGRYAWAFNQAEKATQMGARFAVVTDMIPSDLTNYSFATSCGVPQGDVVDIGRFGGAQCSSSATTATCTVTTSCSGLGSTADNDAFGRLADRMTSIYPSVGRQNIELDYANAGLGYAGDPNGADVSPLVTVSLRDLAFEPMFLGALGITFPIPSASYTLTMEDGQGATSN